MTPGPKQWTPRQTITAGIAGNVLEWYDFAVYGFFAPIIAKQFFPSEDPTVSLIAAYGAFAAGFLMRPFGAAIYGHIGDRYGRGRALVLSITLMAVPTFMIGLLPTYATLGVGAAVLMVLLRMAQGAAVGGEYTSSIVFLAESAPPGRRGFFTGWALFGASGGILLGSGVGAGLSNVLSDADLMEWGWRVAFLGGIAVGGAGYLIRRRMGQGDHETPGATPLKTAFRDHWRAILRVIGLNVSSAVAFYLMFVYVVTWMVGTVKEPQSTAFDINTLAMVSLLLFILVSARLSDRFGRKRMLVIGNCGLMVFSYPLLWLMHHPNPALILTGQIGFAALIATSMGSIPAAITEMFPREIRVTAVSVGYNLAYAFFGGTSPMVAVWLIERTHGDLSFVWYIAAMALVSLIFALMIRDRYNEPLP